MAVVLVSDRTGSRRLRFVLRAVAQRYGPTTVIWVTRDPSSGDGSGLTARFDKEFPNLVRERHTISTPSLRSSVPQVRAALRRASGPVVGMGFASLVLARAAGSVLDIWVVRGIPEELELHRGGLIGRARAWSRWRLAWLAGKPALGIAVSAPMARMLTARTRVQQAVAIPSTVDVAAFAPPAQHAPDRTYLTYLGSGAPWQALDLLEDVWAELARLDPRLRFRVISLDDRAQRIAKRLGDRVQIVGATNGRMVAELLWEARANFLLRRPGPVNEVSWPVKLGEYLAAGAPVVATDVGWDVGQIVRETGAGIVVQPTLSPQEIAQQVLDFLASPSPGRTAEVRSAAGLLDEGVWLDRLVAMLP